MRGLTIIDIPFLAQFRNLGTAHIPNDDMESYSDGVPLNGLIGGANGTNIYNINWSGPYFSRLGANGVWSYDDMESYSNGSLLNGLNLQVAEERGAFTAAYVSRARLNALWASDDMESYADTTPLNGLNGGQAYEGSFTSAYVSR